MVADVVSKVNAAGSTVQSSMLMASVLPLSNVAVTSTSSSLKHAPSFSSTVFKSSALMDASGSFAVTSTGTSAVSVLLLLAL